MVIFMKKVVTLFILVALTTLVGCANQQNSNEINFVRFAAEQKNVTETPKGRIVSYDYFMGSGVSWNEDYVVTAKHVVVNPLSGQTEYVCNNGCDLKFVRRKADGQVPQWRERQNNEPLSAIGATIELNKMNPQKVNRKVIVAKGRDVDITTQTYANADSWVFLARMDTVQGMSGGPLYGEDKNVVGILTGTVKLRQQNGVLYTEAGEKALDLGEKSDPSIEGKMVAYAIYIPYSMIKEQWQSFQAQKMKMAQASR